MQEAIDMLRGCPKVEVAIREREEDIKVEVSMLENRNVRYMEHFERFMNFAGFDKRMDGWVKFCGDHREVISVLDKITTVCIIAQIYFYPKKGR